MTATLSPTTDDFYAMGANQPHDLAYLTTLASAIDQFGLEAFSTAVTELAHRAEHLAPAASRVLTDPSQPMAARERAFARVCLVLTTPMPRPNHGSPDSSPMGASWPHADA